MNALTRPTRANFGLIAREAQRSLQKMRSGGELSVRTKRWQLLDFFCGCGGMSAGFVASGFFRPLGGVDINADALATYLKLRFNQGHQIATGRRQIKSGTNRFDQ